eukprot:jgi/Mesen1/7479/ME000039S06699
MSNGLLATASAMDTPGGKLNALDGALLTINGPTEVSRTVSRVKACQHVVTWVNAYRQMVKRREIAEVIRQARARTAPADPKRGAPENERSRASPSSLSSSSTPSPGGSSSSSSRSSSSSSLHEDARSRGLAAASKASSGPESAAVVVLMPGQELPTHLGHPLGSSPSSQQGNEERAHVCASNEAHAPVAAESAALPPEGTAVAPPPQDAAGGSIQLASVSSNDIGV